MTLGMVMTFKYTKDIINGRNHWCVGHLKLKKNYSVKDNDKRIRSQIICWEKIQQTHWTKDFYPKYERNSKNSRIRKQMTRLKKKNRPKTPSDTSPKNIHRWQINTWKKCFTWCVVREMWIKTTIRHLYAPIRMAKPRILTIRWDTTGSCCWWVCKMAQQTSKAIW